jgi:hypothetical protein
MFLQMHSPLLHKRYAQMLVTMYGCHRDGTKKMGSINWKSLGILNPNDAWQMRSIWSQE